MIVLLGASGYVGQAFEGLLRSKGLPFHSLSRARFDYYNSAALAAHLREHKVSFLVNVAGFTGKPNVDACELRKTDSLESNAILPGRIREACETAKIPWGHVTSGCIYSGRRPDGRGFREDDVPNFSFRSNFCSFYSGTKAMGEEILQGAERCYIWRLRIPFDNRNSPRNYLTKLMTYQRLLDAENSISHLGDFVASCLACWERRLSYGTYNLTNPGPITTREIVNLICENLCPDRKFDYFSDESEFMKLAAKAPRSNCVMDTTKAESAKLPMRPVRVALEHALRNWKN